jgi:hypothetical protein
MTCTNCGKINDSESNFCKYCGDNLSPTETDPNRTIFDRTYQAQPGSNIDLGYLIIAILVLVNVFMWFFWSFIFGGDLSENRNLYKMIRVLSTTLSIAQFAVMFIFAKRPAYKIVIGIIAGIIIIYDFYYLMLSLTDNKY